MHALSKTFDVQAITNAYNNPNSINERPKGSRDLIIGRAERQAIGQRRLKIEPQLSPKVSNFQPKLTANASPPRFYEKSPPPLKSVQMLKSIVISGNPSGSPGTLRGVLPTGQKFFNGKPIIRNNSDQNLPSKNLKNPGTEINQPSSSPDKPENKTETFLQSLLSEKMTKTAAKPSKTSNNEENDGKTGKVKAYGANTNQGRIRNYNEDRVSIVVEISKPPEFPDPRDLKCSLFAVFDGHGGPKCAEFLRDNFYQALIKDNNFPRNPPMALMAACEQIEKTFLGICENSLNQSYLSGGSPSNSRLEAKGNNNTSQTEKNNTSNERVAPHFERSGSCAIIVLILSKNSNLNEFPEIQGAFVLFFKVIREEMLLRECRR